AARGDPRGLRRRGVPAGSDGRARAARRARARLAGRAVRVPRRQPVAGARLRPQRGLPARPPRQRAAVQVPDPVAGQPRRVGARARRARVAALRARRAPQCPALARHLRAPGPARIAPPPATAAAVRGSARGPRRGAAGGGRRLQRLARARPPDAARLRPGRGLRGRERSPRAHLPRAPAAAPARPHLPARGARAAARRAVAAAVDAPVRPRATGLGGGLVNAGGDAHRLRLLENGEEFFARVNEVVAAARSEILLETFILFEDKVGRELHRHLVAAARRGVRVELTVDGYGSPGFSRDFVSELTGAGARLRVFDPHKPLLGMRMHMFRRLHRKLLVVDGERAFVGGINFGADHLADFGPTAKQDYSLEIEGPLVATVRGFMRTALDGDGTGERWRPPRHQQDDPVRFVVRDNRRHSRDIETEYRRAIRAAREEVVIANAYFFPGYGFLRDLRQAARRGVRVSLVVQGEPDTPLAQVAARTLYRHLV